MFLKEKKIGKLHTSKKDTDVRQHKQKKRREKKLVNPKTSQLNLSEKVQNRRRWEYGRLRAAFSLIGRLGRRGGRDIRLRGLFRRPAGWWPALTGCRVWRRRNNGRSLLRDSRYSRGRDRCTRLRFWSNTSHVLVLSRRKIKRGRLVWLWLGNRCGLRRVGLRNWRCSWWGLNRWWKLA